MTLTAKQAASAKPSEKPYKLTDGSGLYLYVAPTGLKSWRTNRVRDGKQTTITYGRFPEMSLADARQAHALARSHMLERAAPTFRELAERWLSVKLPALSNPKHQIQVAETLARYVYPAIGERRIDTLKRADLVEVVMAIQARGTLETAHRVAGRITLVMNYAQDAGLIESHSANGLTRVLMPRRTKKPMASIPPDEAGELIRAINGYDEPVTRLALLLLAHTFVRVGELRGMRWNEINGDVWVVPETRMKLRRPHVVPLSRQVMALLDSLREYAAGDLVIESPLRRGSPVSENTFLFALYRLGYKGRMTAHGFRALASTVLNEQSPFDRDAIERQLAHRETDAVRAAYNRAEYLPERRRMMQWWSDWLDARMPA